MNRITSLLIVASTAASLLSGCATKPTTHTIIAAGNGSTVQLATGDLLRVQLEANPSTGYTWHTIEINAWVLARTERPYFEPNVSPNGGALVGGAGLLTLDYRAVGPGTAPLRLAYFRAWETNGTPTATFDLTVIVK